MTTIFCSMLRILRGLGMPALAACSIISTDSVAHTRDTNPVEDVNRNDKGILSVTGLHTSPGNIELPYHYYRRGSTARPTVFFLGGGPGVSNLKWVPPDSWLRDFDVVVLEYRGVGRSSIVLKSEHFRRAVSALTAQLTLADASTTRDEISKGFADLRRQGVDFGEFSLSEMVEDIERLRKQLGLNRVHLVAHSFGTRVALMYQTRYRDHTEGSVLFSLNTPGGFIWYPDDTASVWRRYRDSKLKTEPEIAAALTSLLEGERKRRNRFGPFAINDTDALTVAFFLSFNSSTRDRAFRAMMSAANGDTGSWFLMALSYKLIVRFGFDWGDFFVKAYTADCDQEAIALADSQGQRSPFQSPSSVLFSASEGFKAAGGRCAPAVFTPDYRATLVIVGEFDPSTPIERKPAALADDRFVVISNAGHADVLYANPSASASWLRRFFLNLDPEPVSTNH